MPRLRTLKPGFFTNDQLAELPAVGRLLFAGLWCVADREGRLYDRPKRIKAEVLPFDSCNVDRLLEQLAERGFIQRYEISGERCIQIVNFKKHQNPHVKEQASTIPSPAEHSASTVPAPDESGKTPDPLTVLAPPVVGSGEWGLGSGEWEPESALVTSEVDLAADPATSGQPMERARALAVPKPGMPIGSPQVALFRAFASALDCEEPATKSERAKWAGPISELVRAGVQADEIAALVKAFDESTSIDVPCTPQGIANRLSALRTPRVKAQAQNGRRIEPGTFEPIREAFSDVGPRRAIS